MSDVLGDKGVAASRVVARGTIVAGLACALMLPSVAAAFNLVTPQEAQASAAYEVAHPPAPFAARSVDPLGPRIEIVSPDVSAVLQSPMAIAVKFHAASGAEIVADSFRAQYGAFRIDITDRLLKATKVTKEGIHIERAELPSGSHRLLLKVQDNAQRSTEREVRFTVQ